MTKNAERAILLEQKSVEPTDSLTKQNVMSKALQKNSLTSVWMKIVDFRNRKGNLVTTL